MQYLCPICQTSLIPLSGYFSCLTGHHFDCAKEGYVNLLPVNKKKSKDPGDNRQMMLARRDFLNKGFYQELSDKINQLALQYQPKVMNLLDLGCGEGYYTGRLYQALVGQCPQLKIQGLDISRSAIRYAAKRYPNVQFCVASSYQMPFAENQFNLLVKVFAPSKSEEMARVMDKGGVMILVSPGPLHHYALKEFIYDKPRLHNIEQQAIPGCTFIAQERLQSNLSLSSNEDIQNFLQMTPYAWKLTDEQKHDLQAKPLHCELDFIMTIYQKM